MSSVSLQLDRRLAQTVAWTGQLKQHSAGSRLKARVLRGIDFVARGVFYVWRNRRYLSALKLANMALINLQFKLKTERVLGRPYNLKIESTNICNTKCQLCPTGLGMTGRPKGKMDVQRYRQLIDGFRRTLFGLDLSMWGDPLIVPEIYDMIRYAHDRGIWTYLSSNLHAFKAHKGHAEALVNSGLDMLTCSLHGASQETYEQYQPGKSLAESVEKVRQIVQTRDRMGSSTPVVQLNFVVTRHNEHERDAFTHLAKELGCKAVFSTASMNTRFLNQDKSLQPLGLAKDVLARKTRQHLQQWLPKDDDFVLKPYRQMLEGAFATDDFNGRKLFDCSWPWRSAVINWDGKASTCCGSWDPAEDMGNVFEQPFSAIWNGAKYRAARRSFRKRIDEAQAKDNPCASCPGFMV